MVKTIVIYIKSRGKFRCEDKETPEFIYLTEVFVAEVPAFLRHVRSGVRLLF